MKVYIPTSMIKKDKSMARHNSDIKLDEEAECQAAIDLFDLEQEPGNPFVESLKVTLVVASVMAMAIWWFYG